MTVQTATNQPTDSGVFDGFGLPTGGPVVADAEKLRPGRRTKTGTEDETWSAGPWFFAPSGSPQQGPEPFSGLRERAVAGQLDRRDLVWRQGMPDWVPAVEVPGLFDGLPEPEAPSPPADEEDEPAGPVTVGESLGAWLSSPAGLRHLGRTALASALLVAVGSALLWLWGHTWFTGAVLLLLVFAVCESAAASAEAAGPVALVPADAVDPAESAGPADAEA